MKGQNHISYFIFQHNIRRVKFIYSEKATKICEISPVDLSYVVKVKSTEEISQNFVAFSECMNFNNGHNKHSIMNIESTSAFAEFNLIFLFINWWWNLLITSNILKLVHFLMDQVLILCFLSKVANSQKVSTLIWNKSMLFIVKGNELQSKVKIRKNAQNLLTDFDIILIQITLTTMINYPIIIHD